MYQSKINILSFISLALLASTATNCLNIKVEAKTPSQAFNHRLFLANINPTSQDFKQHQDYQEILTTPGNTLKHDQADLLLADNVNLETNNSAENESRPDFIRLVVLSFFLLFFVPLGIFYPLFLFYRILLIKPEESDLADDLTDIFNNDLQREFYETASPINIKQQGAKNLNKATVSKLQIAFLPPAYQLRQELSRVTSEANVNGEYDLVSLMHRTIKVLVEQGHWTHVCHDSITLPLEQVKPEFDLISHQERNKFVSKKPSLINYNRNVSKKDGYQRNYSYVVVTLILCTSHSSPLFKTIKTKDQLAKELTALANMEKDSVIKFELLWNPQQEGIYISNDQLLVEYGDMIRLL